MQGVTASPRLPHRTIAPGAAPEPPAWLRVDRQGCVAEADATLAGLLGWQTCDVVGRPLSALAEPAEWADERGPWPLLARGEPVPEQPLRLLAASGAYRLTSVEALRMPGAAGGTGELLVLVRDLAGRWSDECTEARDRCRIQALAFEVTVAASRERERLAHRLHDELSQLLAVARFRVAEIQSRGTAPVPAPLLAELAEVLMQANQAARSATAELHSPVLRQLGLQAAIMALAERTEGRHGLPVVVSGRLGEVPLPYAVQAIVLRVVGELLNNVHKHARAARARVELSDRHGLLEVKVVDDGIGLAPTGSQCRRGDGSGYGLASAAAQIEAIGGLLRVASMPDSGGTCASLVLPLTPSCVGCDAPALN